jgi:MFS family permease
VGSWSFAVRALRSRNYRLYFGGQTVSLVGTWMMRVAMGWLVYRLTGSAALLGIVGFAGQIPTFVLGPIAGVWVDRWNRHRTLLVTQALSMAQSLTVAGLALANVITTGEIIWLAVAQGVVNAFDMPARQAFVVEMVDRREDLSNAIALNSSMVNAARLVGPAIAGVLIAAVGEGYCFLADGLSYLAVIASLFAMRVAPAAPRANDRRVIEELREGWRYVTGSTAIRSILLLLALVSLMGMPYTTLMPVFASDILHGGPHTLGFLMTATGVGALAGAASLAARRSVLGLGRRIWMAAAIFGAALIVFAGSSWVALSLVVLAAAGFGVMQTMASCNTILQTISEDEKRGRVMSFYSMAFQGMAPFGSLMAGGLATAFGAPLTVAFGGIVTLAGAVWFARKLPAVRQEVRPIYAQLGILPEIAIGVNAASELQEPPEN